MDRTDEIDEYLNDFGLDAEDILSVKSRNKYLQITLEEDVIEVLGFLQNNCKLDKDEIKHLIINNPLILTESVQRISLLDTMYKNIGFTGKEYRKYINSFDKAFSLNPKGVFEKIESMAKRGKSRKEIKNIIIKNGYGVFENCI